MWVAEGLLMYLEQDAVKALMEEAGGAHMHWPSLVLWYGVWGLTTARPVGTVQRCTLSSVQSWRCLLGIA